jgi:hypothetical protein
MKETPMIQHRKVKDLKMTLDSIYTEFMQTVEVKPAPVAPTPYQLFSI